MLTISKPLSAGQARAYHQEEFSNARENYYSEGEQIRGEWHGKLAAKWGLHGEVREEHFRRLSDGQHPITGEQLVRHQTARQYVNGDGETVKAMEHRAGWDATFSAPKSVSLTALVGGDERVREAHQASVSVALGRNGAICSGPARRKSSGRNHRELGCRKIRARQCTARGRLRRAAIAHACRLFQSYRNRERRDAAPPAAGTLPHAAVCYGCVSLRTRSPA